MPRSITDCRRPNEEYAGAVDVFRDLEGISPQPIWDGLLARAVHGKQITLAVVEVDPEADLPEHAHDNEQSGIVIRGSLTLRVGGDECIVSPGGTYVIPSGTPHAGRGGPEGAVVIDVFTPPRADWEEIDRQEPRTPRWP
jgi:quercetin dioxygenase-like cupin family protein